MYGRLAVSHWQSGKKFVNNPFSFLRHTFIVLGAALVDRPTLAFGIVILNRIIQHF
jgi:hypothetical protein